MARRARGHGGRRGRGGQPAAEPEAAPGHHAGTDLGRGGLLPQVIGPMRQAGGVVRVRGWPHQRHPRGEGGCSACQRTRMIFGVLLGLSTVRTSDVRARFCQATPFAWQNRFLQRPWPAGSATGLAELITAHSGTSSESSLRVQKVHWAIVTPSSLSVMDTLHMVTVGRRIFKAKISSTILSGFGS